MSFYVKNKLDGEVHLADCLTGIEAVFKNVTCEAKIPTNILG